MKTLLLLIPLLFVACTPAPPMSQAETAAMKQCLDKGWEARFWTNTVQREVTCTPPR